MALFIACKVIQPLVSVFVFLFFAFVFVFGFCFLFCKECGVISWKTSAQDFSLEGILTHAYPYEII